MGTEESTEYLIGTGRPVRVLWQVALGATSSANVKVAVVDAWSTDGDPLSTEELELARRRGFMS